MKETLTNLWLYFKWSYKDLGIIFIALLLFLYNRNILKGLTNKPINEYYEKYGDKAESHMKFVILFYSIISIIFYVLYIGYFLYFAIKCLNFFVPAALK
jgi:hypothetical protein